jgi:hypothetical protein
MSTEEVLRNRIRKKPKVGVRISKNSSRIVTDEGFRGNEEKSGYERRKFYERGDFLFTRPSTGASHGSYQL